MKVRTLWLLRHAKAAHPPMTRDHQRPLAKRGLADAAEVGRVLAGEGRLDYVVCSSALRTRQTWQQAQQGGAISVGEEFTDELYEASAYRILNLIQDLPSTVNSVLLVGHSPGIPTVAAELTQPDAQSAAALQELSYHYPTSGLTRFAFKGDWSSLGWRTAKLISFEVPRAARED